MNTQIDFNLDLLQSKEDISHTDVAEFLDSIHSDYLSEISKKLRANAELNKQETHVLCEVLDSANKHLRIYGKRGIGLEKYRQALNIN